MRRSSIAVVSLLVLACGARAEDAPKDPAPEKPAAPNRDELRGYVGVSWNLAQRLDEEERQETGIKQLKGFVISYVLPGSPAEKAEVRVGDVPLSLNGIPFPDGKDLPVDDESFRKLLEEKVKPHADKIDPGTTVELVVEREGAKKTISMVAIDRKAFDALTDAAREEKNSVKVPKPEVKGTPVAATLDFETVPEGEDRPADFLQVTGFWERQVDDAKPGAHVIAQTSDAEPVAAVALAIGDGRVYGDSKASVRFALKGGEKSASAAIVVRARDRKNYYAAGIDGVAQTVSVVKVENGVAKTIASVPAKSLKLGTWHRLEVVTTGATIEATVGGETKVTAQDATYASGWTGLATFADSTALFDDLAIAPAAGK